MGALVRRPCLDFLGMLAVTWTGLISIKNKDETDRLTQPGQWRPVHCEHLGKPEGDKIIETPRPPSFPVSWQEVGVNVCCSYTSPRSTKAGATQDGASRQVVLCVKGVGAEPRC